MTSTKVFKWPLFWAWWISVIFCGCSEGWASKYAAKKDATLYGPLVTDSCTWVAGPDFVYCVTKERTLLKRLKLHPEDAILDIMLSREGDLLAITTDDSVMRLHNHGDTIQVANLPPPTKGIFLDRLLGMCHGLWLMVNNHEIAHMRENGRWETMAFPDHKGLLAAYGNEFRPAVLYSDRLGDTLYMALRYRRDVSVYAILNPETLQWKIQPYENKCVPPPLALWHDKVVRLDSSFEALPVNVRISPDPGGNISQRNLYYQATPDRFLSQEAVPLPHASWQKVVYLDFREGKVLSEFQTEFLSPVCLYPRQHGVRIWDSGASCCRPLDKFLLSTGNLWQIQLP